MAEILQPKDIRHLALISMVAGALLFDAYILSVMSAEKITIIIEKHEIPFSAIFVLFIAVLFATSTYITKTFAFNKNRDKGKRNWCLVFSLVTAWYTLFMIMNLPVALVLLVYYPEIPIHELPKLLVIIVALVPTVPFVVSAFFGDRHPFEEMMIGKRYERIASLDEVIAFAECFGEEIDIDKLEMIRSADYNFLMLKKVHTGDSIVYIAPRKKYLYKMIEIRRSGDPKIYEKKYFSEKRSIDNNE